MGNQSPQTSGLALAVFGVLVLPGLYLASLYSFNLFHSIAELFAIVVGCGIFMVAWNTRRISSNPYLLFIGVAYLFVATLDLLHLLSYKGMGVFPAIGPDPPIQFWIAARYLEALSLLAAPLFLSRRPDGRLLIAAYALITTAVVVAVFGGVFPTCYVPDLGVTRFKSGSEFVISGILVLAGIFTFQKRDQLDRSVLRLVLWAIGLTIVAELSFSFYVTLFGLFNQLGHYFKLISFYLIYRAIIQNSLTRPYDLLFRDLAASEAALKQSQARLNAVYQGLPIPTYTWQQHGQGLVLADFNRAAERLTHGRISRFLGFSSDEFYSHEPAVVEDMAECLRERSIINRECDYVLRTTGERKHIAFTHAFVPPDLVVSHMQDQTERKKVEDERESLIVELRSALREIQTLSGLLPICSRCKKIRDDQGYWQQIEQYISAHSKAQFSHSICPVCARELYPELMGPDTSPLE